MHPDDTLRRTLLDRRYGDTIERLDRGIRTAEELGAVSAPLFAAILRNRGRLRARLGSVIGRAEAAADMARRTERFLGLRAQYASLSPTERRDLNGLYSRLVDELSTALEGPDYAIRPAIDAATGAHLRRLVALLEAARHAPELMAAARGEQSICATYRPELQLAVLGAAPETLPQPVLDLGAGVDGALVAYLRDRGVDARGIDRLADDDRPYLAAADWMTWDLGRGRWGAILSHMGFSNHFLRHHRRGDDESIRYAERWVVILAALRVGGRFHYAPSLPFIEPFLAPDAFAVRRIAVPGVDPRDTAVSHSTTITRLR